MCTPICFSVTFVMFDNTRQIRPIYFFTGKFAFFSKICVLNRLLGKKEMILYFAPQMPKYLVEPNIKVIACPSQWVTWEKLTKIFVFGTIAIVLQNLVVEFLGPKRMLIQLAQYLSKIRVYPGKLFLDVCQVRWYEKKICRNFFSLERLPFLHKFLFSTTS